MPLDRLIKNALRAIEAVAEADGDTFELVIARDNLNERLKDTPETPDPEL